MDISANTVVIGRDGITVGLTIQSQTWLKFGQVFVPFDRAWTRELILELGRDRPALSDPGGTLPLF